MEMNTRVNEAMVERCLGAALTAALSAEPAERVPEGWVLVPRASLEVAQGDLHRLKKAIEARVPVPALLFRVTEIKRDLCAMLAASPAASEGGKEG